MRAVLVLCEGLHDVLFAQRSLGVHAGCRWVGEHIGALPSPFGAVPSISRKGLIARRMERDVDNLTLRGAAYPVLPHFESIVQDDETDTIYALIRTNGKQQAAAVIDLLEDVDESFHFDVDVSEYAAAFLFDANDVGMTAVSEGFRSTYGAYFSSLDGARHACWTSTATCPVGIFVIHRSATDETGTIDDHVATMAQAAWPPRYNAAQTFLEHNGRPDDEVSRTPAAGLKAIVTCVGQFDHPGAPLSTVVAREGIPDVQFKESWLSRGLVEFLTSVPWDAPPP